MKWLAFIASICFVTGIFGCARDTNNLNNRSVYQKSGNTLNVNTQRPDLYHEGSSMDIRNVSKNYGFVRQQKSPVMNDNNISYAALNREQLANIISRLSTSIPNVNDVSTLVTDQEVLIAYQTNSQNRNMTADQVKKTGMSVVPRYYHVYVTDKPQLRKDVESLSYLDSTNKDARSIVNSVIKEMKKSPQGAPVSKGENANGETPEDQISRTLK